MEAENQNNNVAVVGDEGALRELLILLPNVPDIDILVQIAEILELQIPPETQGWVNHLMIIMNFLSGQVWEGVEAGEREQKVNNALELIRAALPPPRPPPPLQHVDEMNNIQNQAGAAANLPVAPVAPPVQAAPQGGGRNQNIPGVNIDFDGLGKSSIEGAENK